MENRGPWAILRALLLSLLLLLLPPPSPPTPHTHLPLVLGHILSNQVHKPAGSAEDPSAVHLSSSPGQEPLLVLTFDVTKLTKVSSSFELQTWDPEGVIFYGDANVEDDWFMLGLRAGRPEIQMHNPWAQLTVGAGPPLNDGRWHKVDLKIKGDSLLLDVDGEEVLRLSQISGPLHNKSQHIMRLAIGGLLFPLSILRLPLVPALDGCLRQSTWLDPQAQISASAHRSGRSCDTDLQPGTFFPPGTRAEFSLQDLPQPCAEPWAFSVVLELKPTRDSGHLLALGTPEIPSWLSLRLHDQKVVLSSGLEPGLDLPLAWKLPLQLTLNLSSAILSQGLEKKVLALSPLGLDPMFNLWAQPQGRLFLGALPGEDSLASFCLAGLWAQGQKLDMDRALNRSYNLWSHSCPSSLDNVTDTSY